MLCSIVALYFFRFSGWCSQHLSFVISYSSHRLNCECNCETGCFKFS